MPFCQLLTAEGESVFYISPHGQREQGKDVISVASDKTLCAYQLKSGRLALSDWRKFKGEIDELVEYPIDYPGLSPVPLHRPFLVTNGSVSDTVLSAVRSANAAWKHRRHPSLRVVIGSELVARFVRSHGSYLPREPKNFKLFLELVLESGKSPLDKGKLARFLESVLPLRETHPPPMREIHRAIASAALLSSYVLQSCELEKNWWAIFEGWVLTASYCAALSSKYSAKDHWWAPSFKPCELAAIRALENLCHECKSNSTRLIEGDPLTDGHFYHFRITILLGLLSAWNLFRRLRGEHPAEEDFVRRFINENIKNMRMWGESSIPFFFQVLLQLEKFGEQWTAENLAVQLIDGITRANARQDRGLPDPYFGPEESLRLLYELDKDNPAEFRGQSYTLQSLVDFLARRWRRKALARWWERITRIQFTGYRPSSESEWFIWRSQEGLLETRFPTHRQTWSKLLSDAENRDIAQVPPLLRNNPAFAILFSIVYPHRFGPGLVKLLEDSVK